MQLSPPHRRQILPKRQSTSPAKKGSPLLLPKRAVYLSCQKNSLTQKKKKKKKQKEEEAKEEEEQYIDK